MPDDHPETLGYEEKALKIREEAKTSHPQFVKKHVMAMIQSQYKMDTYVFSRKFFENSKNYY